MARLYKHFQNIENEVESSIVGQHFARHRSHQRLDDVEVTIVAFINAQPKSPLGKVLRNLEEASWIQKLHVDAPLGLNVADAPREAT